MMDKGYMRIANFGMPLYTAAYVTSFDMMIVPLAANMPPTPW